jgi:ABC-2 type transport system ATP-binding protein
VIPRISIIPAREENPRGMEDSGKNIILVDQLTKAFDGFLAVDHLSFSVKAGEIFAFLGPNGAGKSTTIRMLTTLLRPTGGSISMDGHDPVASPHKVRETFGIVFQDPSLDEELTAFENMEYHGILYAVPKETRRQRISELLGIVELWERRNDLVKHFSGGMKRRLEIARGLLHHPSILFLDEPTLGLDPQTRNLIWGYIKELNRSKGVTVFFTTHYMEEAERVAHRIAIIDHGRIIVEGTSDELKQKTGTASLEEAFIAVTGRDIRTEEAGNLERWRVRRRIFGRGRR